MRTLVTLASGPHSNIRAHLEAQGQTLPAFVQQEFDELAQQPAMMGKVLEIVYRTLATHLAKKAGLNKRAAHSALASCFALTPASMLSTGALTLIQRFGSALNLNIHFHMLFLDGVYAEDNYGVMRFHRVKAPTIEELNTLVHQISYRVTRFLEKKGWLQRDDERLHGCRR